MITYSMQPLGAFINPGFKMILPFAVQLPQRVGISLNTMATGSVLCFLNLSMSGFAMDGIFDFAFCQYHSFNNSFALDLSEAAISINGLFIFTDSILFNLIFKRYDLPLYKYFSPQI